MLLRALAPREALVLACLACAINGREVRGTSQTAEGAPALDRRRSPFAALADFLLPLNTVRGWQVSSIPNRLTSGHDHLIFKSSHSFASPRSAVRLESLEELNHRRTADGLEPLEDDDPDKFRIPTPMDIYYATGSPTVGKPGQRQDQDRPASVCIAGGGIGGLFTGVTLRNAGYDIKIFERAKEYKPFGGPIQIASNGLEAVKRIDEGLYEDILEHATDIGGRVNGLKDGISNEWFATFDLATPAAKRGMKTSVVIDRPVLQDLLLKRVSDAVTTGVEVIGAVTNQGDDGDHPHGSVTAELGNGETYKADFLVGSDGIKSKMRSVLNPDDGLPEWSGYTCFAAISYFVPHDIKEVGYKVFLGRRKYFVSVDVGGGRIQWYAFLNIPPGGVPEDARSGEKAIEFCRAQVEDWSDEVHELLDNTPFDEVEQRDLYDRPPQVAWASGRVCLLGDAAHPMMPNLGQGGCMAIEDAFVLGRELGCLGNFPRTIPLALKRYNNNRVMRAAAVQGMSRMSSAILFQYNHPMKVDWSSFPPKVSNTAPKSIITRMGQGFLQAAAFPLQFEFLFDFPGPLSDVRKKGVSELERLLIVAEVSATEGLLKALQRSTAYEV